jgi:hypothetical protein
VLRLGGAVEVGHAPLDELEPIVPVDEPGKSELPEAGGGEAFGFIGNPLVDSGVLLDDEALVAPVGQVALVGVGQMPEGLVPSCWLNNTGAKRPSKASIERLSAARMVARQTDTERGK